MGADTWFIAEPLGSAPDARASFLLLRQKKGAKEKATPGAAPRLRRGSLRYSAHRAPQGYFLAMLRIAHSAPAQLGLRPQTVLAHIPAQACVARHLTGGFKHRPVTAALGFPLALCVVEQRRAQRGKGRGLSEGRRPEFRSPPLRTSSAEHPATPGDSAGAPSSWQDKKKCLACRRNTAFHQPPTPGG